MLFQGRSSHGLPGGTSLTFSGALLAPLLFFVPTLHESIATPVFAQSAENCPVSDVILSNPLATPEVTADSGDLRGFALSAKQYLESGIQMSTSNPDAVQPLYFACLARTRGPWNSGANYVVTISTPPGKTGRVVLHANDSALSGRLLRDDFYQELTQGNAGNPRFKPIIRRRKLNYVIDRAFSGSKGLISLLNGLHGS